MSTVVFLRYNSVCVLILGKFTPSRIVFSLRLFFLEKKMFELVNPCPNWLQLRQVVNFHMGLIFNCSATNCHILYVGVSLSSNWLQYWMVKVSHSGFFSLFIFILLILVNTTKLGHNAVLLSSSFIPSCILMIFPLCGRRACNETYVQSYIKRTCFLGKSKISLSFFCVLT